MDSGWRILRTLKFGVVVHRGPSREKEPANETEEGAGESRSGIQETGKKVFCEGGNTTNPPKLIH